MACRRCETLIQASAPRQVIDRSIPTAGLLARMMVAKFADHLSLYRQEKIFGRTGLAIPRSTMAQWVGQTSVQPQPLVDALREVVLAQRELVPEGSATAKTLDYSLKRWVELTRYLEDGAVPTRSRT